MLLGRGIKIGLGARGERACVGVMCFCTLLE